MDLDKRQRAMLREMGVRVWQPVPTPAALVQAEAEVAHAINNIAVGARPERAAARFDAEKPAATALRVPAAVPLDAAPLARPQGVDRMDWPALQAAVATCRACALCDSRSQTVFGVGPVAAGAAAPQVDWLIVGEAPGENEDLAGEPFVGQAGKLLDNMLLAMGLQRNQGEAPPQAGLSRSIFITNVLKCRPPANRNPDPAEVAQCEPYLQRQVELLQPKMILALGKFAAQSLLQGSVPDVQKIPLGKLRGQVFSYLGVPVVVSYHPAYLLRSLGDKAKAWDDLCLALDTLKRPA
ncbi:MAG: uracil-DNA glycosylase [Polaromonas sp.]|nr:uracil-DNA glycosylase [Polaromonas sp.]MDP1742674.1 uracil-DNA glycosylase [Polaromonas sp.]